MSAKPVRPPAVMSACLFMGVACLILLFDAISAIMSWNSLETQEGLRTFLTPELLADSGLSFDDAAAWARRGLLVVIVVLISGVVFAGYAAVGHRVSRIMLTIVGAFAGLAFLVTGGVLGLVPTVFLGYLTARLWSPEASRWFDLVNGREPRPQPPAPVPPQAYAPPPGPYGPPHAPVPAPRPGRTAALIGAIVSAVAIAGSAIYLVAYATAREALVRYQLDNSVSWARMTEAEVRQGYASLAVLSGFGLLLGVVGLVVSIVVLRRSRAR